MYSNMRINLAINDLFHSTDRLKRHIISAGLMFSVFILISEITKSTTEFTTTGTIPMYTLTYLEIFIQYNDFIQVLSAVASVIVPLLICSDIIQSKRKDMGVMKAIGTDPKILYSFYIYQLYIFIFISFVVGILVSGVLYLVILGILESIGLPMQFYWDFINSLIIFVSTIAAVWMFNGYQIRRIGRMSYPKTQHAYEITDMSYVRPNKLVKWLEQRSISMRIALRQVRRNNYELKRTIGVLGFVSALIFISLFSFMTIDTTAKTYLKETQLENVFAIGHKDVVGAYVSGYSRFGNPELDESAFSKVPNFKQPEYRIPTSLIQYMQSEQSSGYVRAVELRIFAYYKVYERPGLIAENYTTYIELMGNRSRHLPILGINLNSTLSKWEFNGDWPTEINHALIGDSLSPVFFNNTLLQGISFTDPEVNRTLSFKNKAIVMEPFNRGFVVILPIQALQQYLYLGDFTNLLLVQWKGEKAPTDQIIQAIQQFCGPDFVAINMNDVLQSNINSLLRIELIPLVVVVLLSILVFITINGFEAARIREYFRDFEIMRAIGAKRPTLKQILFKSRMLLFLLGAAIGLTVSMYFVFFAMGEGNRFPDPTIALLIFFGVSFLYALLSEIDSKRVSKNISKDAFTHFK